MLKVKGLAGISADLEVIMDYKLKLSIQCEFVAKKANSIYRCMNNKLSCEAHNVTAPCSH